MTKDATYEKLFQLTHENTKTLLRRGEGVLWLENILGLLFPALSQNPPLNRESFSKQCIIIKEHGSRLFSILQVHNGSKILDSFFDELPELIRLLNMDVKAIFEGDPAARSTDEIIISYPGFYAIAVHRVSHYFFNQGIPTLPRLLSEHAHRQTGIDIHPGATIGEEFCIDHGTGIVIGETSIIGKNVKIYQGVTLGGLSVFKHLANKKRHPTVEDDVVIYSNTTILGGETVIGKGSIIGGNVWLTESVPPMSRVYCKAEIEMRVK